MTYPTRYSNSVSELKQRCQAAGLTVLDAQVVGRQVCVVVDPFGGDTLDGRTTAVTRKLGTAVAYHYGGGDGKVRIFFMSTGN